MGVPEPASPDPPVSGTTQQCALGVSHQNFEYEKIFDGILDERQWYDFSAAVSEKMFATNERYFRAVLKIVR